jgi:two-component system, cell cycle response regulator
VVEAVDGEDALRSVSRTRPDLILLDVEMPNLDGHGMLAKLREDPSTDDIPVVFLTARSSTEDVVEGLRLGAHDYLRKPFEPAELLARVTAALRVKALQDELRQRNDELTAMSRTDALTGLPNRRALAGYLEEVCSLARRVGKQAALLMVDVDHFKQVNDTHGHDAGDDVLQEVARRLKSVCRTEDMAGRWGGEEFLVIAPMTGIEGAAALGERVRAAIAASPIHVDETGADLAVTASIGATAGVDDGDALLRIADAALYEAKRSGRDRVVTGPD